MRVGIDFIFVYNTLSRLRHPVLDYSGEHNIPMTTNPYGFFLLFSCYLLLRACSLTLDIALPKIRSPEGGSTMRKSSDFSSLPFWGGCPEDGRGCYKILRIFSLAGFHLTLTLSWIIRASITFQ